MIMSLSWHPMSTEQSRLVMERQDNVAPCAGCQKMLLSIQSYWAKRAMSGVLLQIWITSSLASTGDQGLFTGRLQALHT